MKQHIVLVQPEIPQNTGNIARLCVGLNASLHLIYPLGFSIDSKYTKRAGLDYWDKLDLHTHDSIESFFTKLDSNIHTLHYALSSKAMDIYFRHSLVNADTQHCYLYFGSETKGLNELFREYFKQINGIYLKIPMSDECRCLNLSNSVAIFAYEILRQHEMHS